MSDAMTPQLISKHPNMGTTIFSVMSALAAESGAVNLGQGFPDFECDPKLVADVSAAMHENLNQYPPMPGVAPLRQAVAEKIKQLYGRQYDPNSEITITAGYSSPTDHHAGGGSPGRRSDCAGALLRLLRAQH